MDSTLCVTVCLGCKKHSSLLLGKRRENMGLASPSYVLVATCSHGGWIWGLTVSEPCLWAFCLRREGWADEWRVRFQHHETLNGLVTVPGSVCLISHRLALLSPWYSISSLSSTADGCHACEEERGKAPHPHSSCWGNGGTSQAETGNQMIDAVSESRDRLLCCCYISHVPVLVV